MEQEEMLKHFYFHLFQTKVLKVNWTMNCVKFVNEKQSQKAFLENP